MKERPIIFNSEMVRAIIDGRKTQTRRILDPKKLGGDCAPESMATPSWCPYGQLGDQLWVKETWRGGTDTLENVWYKASDECSLKYGFCQCTWKPSIFMPKEFSRITLEITNVLVERLQDISEKDAIAEGVEGVYPIDHFSNLWNKINGPGAWDKNPWVWVIDFNKV